MINPAFLSNSAGFLMFLALCILLLFNWKKQWLAGFLLLASLLSASFFLIQVIDYPGKYAEFLMNIVDIFRKGAFLGFLIVSICRQQAGHSSNQDNAIISLLLGVIVFMVLSAYPGNFESLLNLNISAIKLQYIGHVIISILGLILVEKIWRSTSQSQRWQIKFLCFGIGGIFVYELFLYSDAMLFQRVESQLLNARGAINAICVPLMVVSVARNPEWKLELFVSRHIVYHGTAILAVGFYFIVMAFAGYYVRNTGAEWGATLQIIFLFGAIAVLFILFFSTELRARLKIFITKHFYKNKYDYREEWLGFARSLANQTDDSHIYRTIIKSVTDVIKGPGGALWLKNAEGQFILVDKQNFDYQMEDEISADEEFVKFLTNREWVINLDEYRSSSDENKGPDIPDWILQSDNIWLIQPFYEGGELLGFMLISRPHGNVDFNWEDIDLLKTVGFQTSAYITLLRTSEALSEAKQFETFNRLSAFMVHDIKNIIAQLNFIVSNYPKFGENREFINDAIDTVRNATDKMNKLLVNLGKGQIVNTGSHQKFNILALIEEIIKTKQGSMPKPEIVETKFDIEIWADKDKLGTSISHLLQNAQDATEDTGRVWVDIMEENNTIIVNISDNGCGMDEEFIKSRLFKPFDTTKGNAGMGIGVYESREMIRDIGGVLKVKSHPGKGTVFTIIIPDNRASQYRESEHIAS